MKTTDHSVTERFLRYISYDTQSKEEEEQVPSTKKQLEFSILLAAELKEMGISNVRMDGHGYIYGEISAKYRRDSYVIRLYRPYGHVTGPFRQRCKASVSRKL